MASELKPGVFTKIMADLRIQGEVKVPPLLTTVALLIEKQAKINASSGSHQRGTHTPARPGSGPAVISGTLRRSITHSPPHPIGAGHWECKVGTGVGFYAPHSHTASSRYGLYLETGLRNGSTYPFLRPAYEFVLRSVPAICVARFGPGTWKPVA